MNKSCAYIGLRKDYRSLPEDPTFVPNGSSCGENRMCIEQACTQIPVGCPKNCSGTKIRHPYTGQTFPSFELVEKKDEPVFHSGKMR